MKYLLLFLISINIFSQEKIINIWPGKIPGSIQQEEYNEVTDSSQGWIRVSNVTIPTLAYYPPEKAISSRAAIIICPGGAYMRLAVDHEGTMIANWLNSIGINAFILKYRLPDDRIMTDKKTGPLQDAQEAVRIVRRNAAVWNIDPAKIGVIGFSAGGHLASTISTHYNDQVYESDSVSARPDFSILVYPVISMDSSITHWGSRTNLLGDNPAQGLLTKFSNDKQINGNTPPAFLVHSMDDKTVPVQNSINYFQSLKKFNIPAELHIYEKGGHGYGLGRSKDTEATWSSACEKWLIQRGIISTK